jgi:hypothetical protein
MRVRSLQGHLHLRPPGQLDAEVPAARRPVTERLVRDELAGAEARLSAAVGLQRKLEAILNGEKPFDIYVRWKQLHEQPIGWEPDLNDGVRLNIRPFVKAGVLCGPFNIKWNKDRGKNPDELSDTMISTTQSSRSSKRARESAAHE